MRCIGFFRAAQGNDPLVQWRAGDSPDRPHAGVRRKRSATRKSSGQDYPGEMPCRSPSAMTM